MPRSFHRQRPVDFGKRRGDQILAGNAVEQEEVAEGSSGILTTAGKLLFSGDPQSNLIARDPATGEALWHTRLHAPVSNGPMTYELDGRQYLVVGAGDSLYAFTVLE